MRDAHYKMPFNVVYLFFFLTFDKDHKFSSFHPLFLSLLNNANEKK